MVVLPSNSQEANHLVLTRTVHGEVTRAFAILALLLMNERSDSAESSNMLRIWILIRTSLRVSTSAPVGDLDLYPQVYRISKLKLRSV
jgi:hypothetical protein